eukprot:Anaeramoba_ignava/a348118_12.p1 GENE.a348118_12~~a348118_12.p1  ORF type:complete len:979 (+),score=139.90 a348118_12:174-3110(+)
MQHLKSLIILIAALGLFSCGTGDQHKVIEKTDANGYNYKEVTNDPYNARIYTLENGLKVYLSIDRDEPRIQTYIPVKAGSSYDPQETTGLAHYLEHMMFKGSSKIGAVNWEKEKVLLANISDLYEKHKAAETKEEKKKIYAEIDKLSTEAAQYVAPNEYDKLISSIGGNGTNAYTSNERTVYMNNIPANELEKWLQIESERFSQLVLRLFHTELETVYEEFNMGQDQDQRQAYYKLMELLYPNHVYGEQTTIGKPEHLKNPSMVNIHNYFDTYYVANNMAVAMVGDLDFENTIQLIDKYFGKYENKPVAPVKHGEAGPINGITKAELSGPQPAFVQFAYRFNGIKSEDRKYVSLIDHMLSNRSAGLIDINLVQKQQVQMATSYPSFMKDYGMHAFYGMPRQGQELQEVVDLILAEIEKIKSGDFEDWMIEACINDLQVRKIRKLEGKWKAHDFVDAFTNDIAWENYITFLEDLEKIKKEDLVKFANEHYTDNYVVVYKKQGEKQDAVKVDKPEITPIDLNRNNESEFYKNLTTQPTERLNPLWLDFDKRLATDELQKGLKISYIKNEINELFRMEYIIPMGKNHNNKIPLAINYLEYLGTDKYSPAELKKEFFRYGLSFGVYSGDEDAYVYISGLKKSLPKAFELMEHMLANAKPDQEAYDKYVATILKDRSNAKEDKNQILWGGMLNYGLYGEKSSFRNIIPEEDLRSIDPKELTDLVRDLYNYNHEIFYYGTRNFDEVKDLAKQFHKVPGELKPAPKENNYAVRGFDKSEVYFVDYDMVQSNILFLSKDKKLDLELIPFARTFNEFYGSGLSSVVFQEIRESKALAYSAFSAFITPQKPEDHHFIYGFVGTQPDKIQIATSTLIGLMNEMPDAQKQFEAAKDAIMKQIESERITKDRVYWTYRSNKKKGIDYDIRKDIYNKVQSMTFDEFEKFFKNDISGKKYTFMVMGDRDRVNFNVLAKLGKVKELTLEELYNY